MAKVFPLQTFRNSPTVILARVRDTSGALVDIAGLPAEATVIGQKQGVTMPKAPISPSWYEDPLPGSPDNPDPRWQPGYETENGYNFEWTVPGSAFPEADHYRVEISFTDVGGTIMLVAEGPAQSTGPYS